MAKQNLQEDEIVRVLHRAFEFLGASPDGIIITENPEDYRYGKLVEFKCPISREFTDTSPIPPAYFHQMQLQMECTGIDECEYIEVQFKELNYTEFMKSNAEIKSFFSVHKETGNVLYADFNNDRDYITWKEKNIGDNWEEYSTTFWMLNNWRAVSVKHQSNWLNLHLPSLTTLWNEVLEYRRTGQFPQSQKEKATLIL